jgi:hypothetical protein
MLFLFEHMTDEYRHFGATSKDATFLNFFLRYFCPLSMNFTFLLRFMHKIYDLNNTKRQMASYQMDTFCE